MDVYPQSFLAFVPDIVATLDLRIADFNVDHNVEGPSLGWMGSEARAHICTRTCTYMHTHMHILVHAHATHTHTHTHTHTLTHTITHDVLRNTYLHTCKIELCVLFL